VVQGYDGSNPLTILSTQLITKHYNIHTNLDFERLDYFEKFVGRLDEDGKLHITFGYFSNERLPQAKEIMHKFTFSELIGRGGFPQSLIRTFVMFLHKKGKFIEFIRTAAEWQKWWSGNRHRLYLDSAQQIYRVKAEYKKSPVNPD